MGIEHFDYPPQLDAIVTDFKTLDRNDRIQLLLDYAARLPEVPDRLRNRPDLAHGVPECRAQLTFYVEVDGDGIQLWIEMVEQASVVAAVATILIEGCAGAPREQLLAIPSDLPIRVIGPEMVGQRRYGLMMLVERIKRAVAADVPSAVGLSDATATEPQEG